MGKEDSRMTLEALFSYAAVVLGLAALVMFGRLIAGPTLADRAVALDAMNTPVVAMMMLLSVIFDSIVMVDVAIVYAGLSFVGTMFIARYLEGSM